MLVFGNPIASRGVSSPAVAVSVTLATMIVIPTIRIVCYTSKAFQVVPTSAPMNVLTLGNSIASREVISPAVAAKMVAMPTVGTRWLHFESFWSLVYMVDIRYLSTRRMLDCDRLSKVIVRLWYRMHIPFTYVILSYFERHPNPLRKGFGFSRRW